MDIDLKSGQSYWLLKNRNLPAFPPLRENVRADVAIVGAGVTGAIAAYLLTEAGLDVVLVDKRTLGQGSTGASTALLCYEPDTLLVDLVRKRGAQSAVRALELSRDANEFLGDLVARLDIACGYSRKASFYLASSPADVPRLQDEYAARRAAGFALDFLSGEELRRSFAISAPAALVNSDAGQLDPVQLTLGLLERGRAAGLRLYVETDVTRLSQTESGFELTIANGGRIDARRVVIATGYETQPFKGQPGVALSSTYVIATSVVEGMPAWLSNAIMWDSGLPYHYLRTTNDGRILLGGGDEDFVDEERRDALMPAKASALRAHLSELLPWLNCDVYSVWCGTFGGTDDGLPYIGEYTEMPGVHFALGYGGNGITFGVVAARMIRDAMAGVANEDAAIFSFDR